MIKLPENVALSQQLQTALRQMRITACWTYGQDIQHFDLPDAEMISWSFGGKNYIGGLVRESVQATSAGRFQVTGYYQMAEDDMHLEVVLGFECCDTNHPIPRFEGRCGFAIQGPGHFEPRFRYAHELAFVEDPTGGYDFVAFPCSVIADQTCRWMAGVISLKDEKDAETRAIFEPAWSFLPNRDFLYPLGDLPPWESKRSAWCSYLAEVPYDAHHGWEYTRTPYTQAGDQARFGWDPVQDARLGDPYALDMLYGKMLRVHGCYPQHVDFPRYIQPPNEAAPYFFVGLHEHSRNRLGRPNRWSSMLPEYLKGRKGWEAPDPQHATNLVPTLAHYSGSLWAMEQSRRLGFMTMCQINDPRVAIEAGGNPTSLFPHHRATGRLLRLLEQCQWASMPISTDGVVHFLPFRYDCASHIYSIWRPLKYGDWEDYLREEGHVDGKPAIPIWELGYMIPALVRIDTPEAHAIVTDLANLLIKHGIERRGGAWGAWKLVQAENPAKRRFWDPRHDGQNTRLYGALVLLEGRVEGELETKRREAVKWLAGEFEGLPTSRFGMAPGALPRM